MRARSVQVGVYIYSERFRAGPYRWSVRTGSLNNREAQRTIRNHVEQ